MTLGPTLGVIILINNYLHDVATAMLASSGAALWIIIRKYDAHKNEKTAGYFIEIYRSMGKVAKFSLVWLLAGGIPRTLFYRDFEWYSAVDLNQIPALIVKHILEFTLVATGVYLWVKVHKKVQDIEQELGSENNKGSKGNK